MDISRALELSAADVFITHELYKRAPGKTDYLQGKLALQDLAARMVDQPEEVSSSVCRLGDGVACGPG